ncbi:transmembrane protein 101-like [Saccostrea echinata]|uniref:transmembrane protein 101-like n=1 Tax=Saccostrea echinata TaxID=191078 RepID=UPI002A8246DF|nr:transmembrane protein 101-like [Saccostrea echinata]
MASSQLLRKMPEFFIARFPFFNAISLLLLLAERAQNESYPPIPPKVIYTHIGIFVACGFLLSFRYKCKEVSLVYCGQILYLVYIMFTNPQVGYTQWQKIRIASRHIGCVGMFLLFSSLFENLPSKQLQKLGETVVGIFLMAYVYILNNSTEDRRAFLSHIPGGDWTRYFITLALAAGAISFFSGHFLRDMSITVICVFGILTIFVDCDINFWVETKGMLFWNQVRLIIDDLCILLGFAMIVVRVDNRIKMD